MEYFSLEHGHLASIIMPMFLLFNNIANFFGEFFSRKYEKRILIIGFVLGLAGTGIFYILSYGPYFCFIWLLLFTFGLPTTFWYCRKIDKILNKEAGSYKTINIIDKCNSFFSIAFGIFFILLPLTPIYKVISGGNKDIKTIIVSKTILIILGLSYIILNKLFANTIYRIRSCI